MLTLGFVPKVGFKDLSWPRKFIGTAPESPIVPPKEVAPIEAWGLKPPAPVGRPPFLVLPMRYLVNFEVNYLMHYP